MAKGVGAQQLQFLRAQRGRFESSLSGVDLFFVAAPNDVRWLSMMMIPKYLIPTSLQTLERGKKIDNLIGINYNI